MRKMWILRKIIRPIDEIDAVLFLINKLAMTAFLRNDETLILMPKAPRVLRGISHYICNR